MDLDRDYYLFLADVKHSTRGAPQARQDVFETLNRVIASPLPGLDPGVVIPLSLSYGDEIAGLFHIPEGLYDLVMMLRDALHPREFRFVVCRGRVGVASDDIRQVGGEVFKRANLALRRLKRRRRFGWWSLDLPWDEALTVMTETSHVLYRGMTDYQRGVYGLLRDGHTQKQIAERLGKHQQSVSDAVRRGRSELVIDVDRAIRSLLEKQR